MIITHQRRCERNHANRKIIDTMTISRDLHKLQIYLMPSILCLFFVAFLWGKDNPHLILQPVLDRRCGIPGCEVSKNQAACWGGMNSSTLSGKAHHEAASPAFVVPAGRNRRSRS
jgi:hypothetical protein